MMNIIHASPKIIPNDAPSPVLTFKVASLPPQYHETQLCLAISRCSLIRTNNMFTVPYTLAFNVSALRSAFLFLVQIFAFPTNYPCLTLLLFIQSHFDPC